VSKQLLAVKLREVSGRRVLVPADTITQRWAADAPLDALMWATVKRPRSPKFHRAMHKVCDLLAEHCEAFEGLTGHSVLKRIQLEANIECEQIAYNVPKYGMVLQRVPRSLRFEDMGEEEFRTLSGLICDYVAATYWPEFGLHLLNKPEAA
jgi:hypothetical protein